MHLIPRDPNVTREMKPSAGSADYADLAAMVRGLPVADAVTRSGRGGDLDLSIGYGKALAAAAEAPPLPSTSGSEIAERRTRLLEAARIQRSALAVVAARSAVHGALAGGLAGIGLLALKSHVLGGRRG